MKLFRSTAAVVSVGLIAGCERFEAAKFNPQQVNNPWVIRTDFSDDLTWNVVSDEISSAHPVNRPELDEFFKFVEEPQFAKRSLLEMVQSFPDGYPGMVCYVVDEECITNREHPILVVGFYPSDHKSYSRVPRNTLARDITTFRALPSEIMSIENNLAIANMDFEEFANAVDKDGVFRGF